MAWSPRPLTPNGLASPPALWSETCCSHAGLPPPAQPPPGWSPGWSPPPSRGLPARGTLSRNSLRTPPGEVIHRAAASRAASRPASSQFHKQQLSQLSSFEEQIRYMEAHQIERPTERPTTERPIRTPPSRPRAALGAAELRAPTQLLSSYAAELAQPLELASAATCPATPCSPVRPLAGAPGPPPSRRCGTAPLVRLPRSASMPGIPTSTAAYNTKLKAPMKLGIALHSIRM